MSDENSGPFLLRRISELERQVAEANAEAKKRRIEKKAVAKEAEDLRAERDALAKEREALQASPGEWQRKAEELQKQVRVRDHRDAWHAAIGDMLNEKVPLEEVWSKLKYEPGDQIPTSQEIKEQVKAARDAAPYLFRQETATPAPGGAKPTREALHVPLDASRGDRDTGLGKFVVRQSDMRNPIFMMANSKKISEASRDGNLTVLPD